MYGMQTPHVLEPYATMQPMRNGGLEQGEFAPSAVQAGGPLPSPVQPDQPVQAPPVPVEAEGNAVRDSQNRIVRAQQLGQVIRAIAAQKFGRA